MKYILIICLIFPLLVLSQSSFDQAQKLFEEGKFEQSRTIFESLLKKDPSNLKTNEYLGDIAGQNKLWDEAIKYYGKLKELKSSEANFYYKYGGALGMKALTVNKFRALGMIDEIKGSFEKTIELDSRHVDARWALIELYLKLPGIVGGSETKAIKYSKELLKLSPVDFYMSRGRIDEYYKRYKAAEFQYKKAIAVGSSAASYQMLANLYKNKMDQPEKAKMVLEEFRKKSNR
jgi:tetratricopeptide (TPR) repeat protein